MTNQDTDKKTFRRIRSAIGYLGIGLPIVLVLLSSFNFFDTPIQQSISHYYYTNLREIFTGVLCAVGLFLIRYQGYGNKVFWKNDSKLTNIAGGSAFGIAFVPTNPDDCTDKLYTIIPVCNDYIGLIHYGFAAVFFVALSVLSLFAFTIGQKNKNLPDSIFNENKIYRTCGILILVFIILVPFNLFNHSTLVFEALSLFTFGFSWLIKGRFLGEKGKIGEILYKEKH
jgi:hypothetical protein